MSLKNDELYEYYLAYLSTINLSESKLSLFKISKSYFDKFVIRYRNDDFFKNKIEKKNRSIVRDKKLNNLFQSYDTKNY